MNKNQKKTLLAFIVSNAIYALFCAILIPSASHNLQDVNFYGTAWFSYYEFVVTFSLALFLAFNTYFVVKLKRVF
jgi:hypothetical protein